MLFRSCAAILAFCCSRREKSSPEAHNLVREKQKTESRIPVHLSRGHYVVRHHPYILSARPTIEGSDELIKRNSQYE